MCDNREYRIGVYLVTIFPAGAALGAFSYAYFTHGSPAGGLIVAGGAFLAGAALLIYNHFHNKNGE